jgi:hypothetical protein
MRIISTLTSVSAAGSQPLPRASAARSRAWRGAAILSRGFRPFFLAAGVWALIGIALWPPILVGEIAIPTAFYAIDCSWTLLHGDDDAVRELAAALGVGYRPDGEGGFDHAAVISLIDEKGEIVVQQRGTQASSAELLAALNNLLEKHN